MLIVEDIQVYLTRDRNVLPGDKLLHARQIAREALLENAAVFAAFTSDELQSDTPLHDALTEQFRKTFHRDRSGDVLFTLRPYYMQSKSATTHGSPWRYDTHVPLVLLGPGIRAGRFATPASPAQIGPTLAKLLDIDAPAENVESAALEALQLSSQ